jgi:iron complex transport system substrate-binding protein
MVEQFGGIHRAIVMRLAMSNAKAVSLRQRRFRLPYNKRVTASHHPRRIACLQPSATVILASVEELDRVVACTKYCADVVPELRDRARLIIADSWTSKATEILAARPDLVIAAVPYQEAAVVEILKAGIRFLGLAPRTLDDIYTDIALIAGAVGAGERGAKVICEMREEIEEVRRRVASLPRKRVFCEEWGKPIIASQAWVAELVDAAGGEFLGQAGVQCSAPEIARMDPEVIIVAWCGAGDRVPLAKIVAERGWRDTSAARNSQVYCISDELLNTPAPTLVAGLRALAGAIHPLEIGAQRGLRCITQVPHGQVPTGR